MKKFLMTILCVSLFVFTSCVESGGKKSEVNTEFTTVYNAYVAYSEENGVIPFSYDDFLAQIKDEDGTYPTIKISEDGYFIINGIKTEYYAEKKKSDGYIKQADLYRYNVKDASGGKATTCKIINGRLENINLPSYDTIFLHRNRFTSVIVRIGLKGDTVERAGKLQINLTKSDAEVGKKENQTFLSATSSSVIRFLPIIGKEYYDVALAAAATVGGQYENDFDTALYEALSSGMTAGDHTATGVYAGISAAEDPTGLCFTTITMTDGGETATRNDDKFTVMKTKRITTALNYTAEDWNSVNGEDVLYLYVFMAYDTTLFYYYLEGVAVTDVWQEIQNDLQKITITQVSGN